MLSAQVLEHARANERKYREKIDSWTGRDGKGNGIEAIMRYINYYDGQFPRNYGNSVFPERLILSCRMSQFQLFFGGSTEERNSVSVSQMLILGLGELAFFFVKWAEHQKVSMGSFREVQLIRKTRKDMDWFRFISFFLWFNSVSESTMNWKLLSLPYLIHLLLRYHIPFFL